MTGPPAGGGMRGTAGEGERRGEGSDRAGISDIIDDDVRGCFIAALVTELHELQLHDLGNQR